MRSLEYDVQSGLIHPKKLFLDSKLKANNKIEFSINFFLGIC